MRGTGLLGPPTPSVPTRAPGHCEVFTQMCTQDAHTQLVQTACAFPPRTKAAGGSAAKLEASKRPLAAAGPRGLQLSSQTHWPLFSGSWGDTGHRFPGRPGPSRPGKEAGRREGKGPSPGRPEPAQAELSSEPDPWP